MGKKFEEKVSDVSKLTASEFNRGIADLNNAIVDVLVNAGIDISTFENQEALNHFILARQSSFSVGGSANAITISSTTAFGDLKVKRHFHGQIFCFLPIASNTGATTIKVDDLAIKNITNSDGTAVGGFIKLNRYCYIRYNADSDRYELANPITSGITGTGGFTFTNDLPYGALWCRGGLYSRTTYADLFAKIGTTYGAGDGLTTFKVPDLQGYTLRGLDLTGLVDTNNASGSTTAGSLRILGSIQQDDNKSHSHRDATGYYQNSALGSEYFAYGNGGFTYSGDASYKYTGGAEARMKNIAVNFFIYY